MLQAAANIAPRGVYVCGNTTTTSGLTVTLSKESGSGGDYALEAGALVLADQGRWYVGRGGGGEEEGDITLTSLYAVRLVCSHPTIGCCCIDEFDKMGSQHQALLEAMVTH